MVPRGEKQEMGRDTRKARGERVGNLRLILILVVVLRHARRLVETMPPGRRRWKDTRKVSRLRDERSQTYDVVSQ